MREKSGRLPDTRRITGLALMGGAVLGGVLVVIGLFGAAFGLGGLERSIDASLARFDETLILTTSGLDTATATLGEADSTLTALSATLGSTTRAISDTLPTIATVADLTGDDLPEAIRSTQSALGSARETARVIDRVLGTISGFGLLSSGTYNPEVPLNEAIADVSTSLDDLPAALLRLDRGLRTGSTSLAEVNTDLVDVVAGVDEITESLRTAGGSLDDYRSVVAALRDEIADLRERLPPWFFGLRIGLLLGLLWLAIAQVSLYLQGWELVRRR